MFKIQTSPLLAWDLRQQHLAMHGLLNFKKKQEKALKIYIIQQWSKSN